MTTYYHIDKQFFVNGKAIAPPMYTELIMGTKADADAYCEKNAEPETDDSYEVRYSYRVEEL